MGSLGAPAAKLSGALSFSGSATLQGPAKSSTVKNIAVAEGIKSQLSGKISTLLPTTDDPNFSVIKGPILNQMQVHYFLYGIILVISNYTQFSFVWLWSLPLYAFVSFSIVEICRVFLFLNQISMLPLYSSFIPYIIFHVMARDGALYLSVFWFISVMAINIQIGTHELNKHVILASLIFIVMYVGLMLSVYLGFSPQPQNGTYSIFSSNIYTTIGESCDSANVYTIPGNATLGIAPKCYKILTLSLSYTVFYTFLTALALFCAALFTLQRHIRLYGYTLIASSDEVKLLCKQNDKLKTQLDAIRPAINLNLDSPITKIIKRIRRLQDNYSLRVDQMESLDYVVQILSSNQLFLPNLQVGADAMDAEVNQFLTSMITNDTKVVAIASAVTDINEELDESQYLQNQLRDLSTTESGGDFLSSPVELQGLLENVLSWDFDIFRLTDASHGRPLFTLGMSIFEQFDFAKCIGTPKSCMAAFLTKVEAGYRRNPYHNSTHAADVMHAMNYFLEVMGLKKLVTIEDCFAGIIAAAIHDLDHPGVNNAFLINTFDTLAIRYNDTAVLEAYHCAKAFEMMESDEGCNILKHLSLDRYKTMRQSIVSMVLATDMANHFEYISKFTNKVNGSGINISDPADRQLAMNIAIKCSDISNGTKSLDLCQRWASLIMEEFFAQGDLERARGLPVSTFMDRSTTIIPKCQVGFLDYIVSPLIEIWEVYMNEEDNFEGLKNLVTNREFWKSAPENYELRTVKIHRGR